MFNLAAWPLNIFLYNEKTSYEEHVRYCSRPYLEENVTLRISFIAAKDESSLTRRL